MHVLDTTHRDFSMENYLLTLLRAKSASCRLKLKLFLLDLSSKKFTQTYHLLSEE